MGLRLATIAAVLSFTCVAQDGRFEVISIKTAQTTDPTAGATRLDPGERFTVRSISAKLLAAIAFDLRPSEISGGPRWVTDDRYEVIAKGSGENRLTLEALRPMVRALLVSRFKLRYHVEKKEVPAYGLVVAKSGGKLREPIDPEAVPSLLISGDGANRSTITSINSPLSRLAQTLQMQLEQRVFDRTSLEGNFNFQIVCAPIDATESSEPSIFIAIQEQVGLKLEPERDLIDTVVIDGIEKPSAN